MAVNKCKISLRRIHDAESEMLKEFSCGRPPLDTFLCDDAGRYDRHGLTSTVVVFYPELPAPVAYFSLSADSVHLSGVERTDLGLPFDAPVSFYPAVKLTKLAVTEKMQGMGIGKYLIDLICGIASSAPFAVRLLTVDAINQERVRSFCEHVGFIDSLSEKKERGAQKIRETILMFKDLYQ